MNIFKQKSANYPINKNSLFWNGYRNFKMWPKEFFFSYFKSWPNIQLIFYSKYISISGLERNFLTFKIEFSSFCPTTLRIERVVSSVLCIIINFNCLNILYHRFCLVNFVLYIGTSVGFHNLHLSIMFVWQN